jgi:mycofactocin glycosyltransferase
MSADVPYVSIVLPVRNGGPTLRRCLVSLLGLDYPAERREIVVVDNASTDSTAEIIRQFPVRSLRENRPGHSEARNRGIGESVGEILAFTDADCAVSTRWLRELVAGFDDETAAVAGDAVAFPPETAVERYVASRRPTLSAWATCQRLPWFQFNSVGVRRAVFEQIGTLDTRFRGGAEDMDFCWRILRAGLVLRRRPQALVFHHHRASVRGLVRQHVGYGRGQAALSRKYPAEIPWTLASEIAAWRDLAASASNAVGAAVAPNGSGSRSTEASYAALDLMRKLAQRYGFVTGLAVSSPFFPVP